MNNNLKFLLLGTSLSLIPSLLYAQCSPAQNCAELGYKETANKGGCLKYPFGNGWYCPQKKCDDSYQYTCTGNNEQSGTDKCGDKYKSCTCDSGYEWKDGKCQVKGAVLGQCTGYAQNCKIGDILNSDGTCTTDKVSGTTPIGVVVYISGGSDKCGYAMTISPISTDIPWSREYVATGIGIASFWQNAIKDFDACINTQKIIQLGDSFQYPAAWAAVNYTPNAAVDTKGKWCLPAPGMLNSLYTNLNLINNTISKLGGTRFSSLYDDEHIWSSSESSSSSAWLFCTNTQCESQGGLGNYSKTYSNRANVVRPVLAF